MNSPSIIISPCIIISPSIIISPCIIISPYIIISPCINISPYIIISPCITISPGCSCSPGSYQCHQRSEALLPQRSPTDLKPHECSQVHTG